MLGVLMILGVFHHGFHDNMVLRFADSLYVKLCAVYLFYWYNTCLRFLIMFSGVLGCYAVVYVLDVRNRDWGNIWYITPNMFMHVCSGTAIYFAFNENVQSSFVEGGER